MFWISRGRGGEGDDDRELEAAILRLLLIEESGRLSAGELAREVGHLAPSELALDDAIARLERAGLVNRLGELAVVSRAARYFDGLAIY